MLYKAILSLINLNSKNEKNSLHIDYIGSINSLINKEYNVIMSKRKNKNE